MFLFIPSLSKYLMSTSDELGTRLNSRQEQICYWSKPGSACSPWRSKANALTPGCGEGRAAVIAGHQARVQVASAQKAETLWRLLLAFREKCFVFLFSFFFHLFIYLCHIVTKMEIFKTKEIPYSLPHLHRLAMFQLPFQAYHVERFLKTG